MTDTITRESEEKTRQVIPLPPPETPPKPDPEPQAPPTEPSPRTEPASHLFTFVCALFCILTVTAAGINLVTAAGRTSLSVIALRLANRAFLGCGVLAEAPREEESSPPAVTMPDPPAEPEIPPDTKPPADTGDPPDSADRYPIERADLSADSVHTLFNETDYRPDTAALLAGDLPFPRLGEFQAQYGADAPYILILHTHGTEGFLPEGADTYTTEDPFRSTDPAQNVVAVGAVMAETFRAAGIPVIHCTEMFDLTSYQDSYNRAAAAIREYLAAYPSIRIVLDVHRDSIIRADMTKIRPTATVDGAETAQFMIVAGTDFKGANHPDWTENLSFALKIQENLLRCAPHFARAVNLRGAGFNQQYTPGSLLLEVGSCGNTLTEAKRAGITAAIAIADVVTEGGCDLVRAELMP